MNGRDFDYIEARLLAPAVAASEAGERLRLVGRQREADELLAAHRVFMDACRAVRDKVRLTGSRQ
jgi:hypothetical protein